MHRSKLLRPHLVLLLAAATSCSTAYELPRVKPGVEARSLLGEPLVSPEPAAAEREKRESDLEIARENWEKHPEDPLSWVWYGRRLAYAGRYRDAVRIYTQGLDRFPDDPRLLRHRGHRWITLREFERAEDDLERAAKLARGRPDEPEPPGTRDPRRTALDSLHRNIHYHLALARFLQGKHAASLDAWRLALAEANDAESRVAVLAWTCATYARLGHDERSTEVLADWGPSDAVVENGAYQDLCRFYHGDLPLEELEVRAFASAEKNNDAATIGFQLGSWLLAHGETERARELFERVRNAAPWPAFGVIAAEAELAQLSSKAKR